MSGLAQPEVARRPGLNDPLAPLRELVLGIGHLLDRTNDEPSILREGSALLARLVSADDWLTERHARPGPDRYRQYLLHRDPRARFSVVSFVWGPGQATPIHDHTVWGLVGMLRGAEVAERFERRVGGLRSLGTDYLEVGAVDAVSPTIGDLHRVSNALDDRVSISIHVYGGDIGTIVRSTYDTTGRAKAFVSGYEEASPPDLRLERP